MPEGITPSQVEDLQRTIEEWNKNLMEKPDWTNFYPYLLEDWTITLIGYTITHFYLPMCEDCKTYKRCLKESREWINTFIGNYVNSLPENGLIKFWKSILSGSPQIETDLLDKYFGQRFNLEKEGNSTNLLKVFEDRRLLPFFYSKVIPASLGMLAEGLVLPSMKDLGTVYKKFRKKPKEKPIITGIQYQK